MFFRLRLLGLAAFLLSRLAFAADPDIRPGWESEANSLISPIMEGQEVAPGWKLTKVAVNTKSIWYEVTDASGQQATLRLEHLDKHPEVTERSKSFVITRELPAGAPSAALDALSKNIQQNDFGQFWNRPWEDGGGDRGGIRAAWNTLTRLLESHNITRLWNDGILLFFVAFGFLLVHLRRHLRGEPKWVGWTLLGIVVVAGIIRAWLSRENLMEAWAYSRVSPLAQKIYEGPVLQTVSGEYGFRLYLSDLIFKSNFVIATLTPLALFAHARYILKDVRAAVAAAVIVAFLPQHIRFSRSDVYFIQSVATSSLTFVVLYTAMYDASKFWRTFCFLLLPFLCTATYFLRPENIVFVVLDLGAIYICMRVGVPKVRTAIATVTVVSTALFAFVANLLARYRGNVERGLSIETLRHAVTIFFDRHLNTPINPWITPPGLTLLAIAGVIFLWRRGEQVRSVFLVAWITFFFIVHSYVVPNQAAMQARYHINLISPIVLMAAAAVPDLLRFPRWVPAAIAAYVFAWPVLHRDFIQDTKFNEMREYDFITSFREKIPPGCAVLEYVAAPMPSDPKNRFPSRVGRVSQLMKNGSATDQWWIVPLKDPEPVLTASAGGEFHTRGPIDLHDAEDILENPPACTMFYEGLMCFSHHGEGETMAGPCDEVHRKLKLEPVATLSFDGRAYDPVTAGPLIVTPTGETHSVVNLVDGKPITITLYKATK